MSVSRTSSPLSPQTSAETTPKFVYASVIRSVGNTAVLPTPPPQMPSLLKQSISQIRSSQLVALLAPQQELLTPPRPISPSFQQPSSRKKLLPYGHLDKNLKETVKKRAVELLLSKPKKTRMEVINNLKKEFKVEYSHANLKRCATKARISFDDEITAKKIKKEEAKRKAIQYVKEQIPYRTVAKAIGVAPSTISNWMKEHKNNMLQPNTIKKSKKSLNCALKTSIPKEKSNNSNITIPKQPCFS